MKFGFLGYPAKVVKLILLIMWSISINTGIIVKLIHYCIKGLAVL